MALREQIKPSRRAREEGYTEGSCYQRPECYCLPSRCLPQGRPCPQNDNSGGRQNRPPEHRKMAQTSQRPNGASHNRAYFGPSAHERASRGRRPQQPTLLQTRKAHQSSSGVVGWSLETLLGIQRNEKRIIRIETGSQKHNVWDLIAGASEPG